MEKRKNELKKENIIVEKKLITEENIEIQADKSIEEGANGISTEFKI